MSTLDSTLDSSGRTASTASRRPAAVFLALLGSAYALALYDRQLMAVVSEMVKHEFGLSDKELSLLNGAAFVVIYGICGIAAGWLSDRASRKLIMASALVFWSLMAFCSGAAHSLAQLALARAGVGIGQAAAVPVGISAIADRFSPRRRPMALAIFYTGGSVGILACFLAGTWVVGRYGWRVAFFVTAPPGLVVAALIARFLREPTREAPSEVTASLAHKEHAFRLIWRNRPLCWLLLAGAVAAFANVGLLQWLPIFFLRNRGLTLRELGIYFGTTLALGLSAGLILGGWIGNRAARSTTALIWVSTLTMVGVVPLYLLMLWLPWLPAALIATLLATILSVLYSPSYNAAWQAICHPRARGTAAGISLFSIALIGGSACTFVVGALSDRWRPGLGVESLRYALTVSLSFCVAAAALFAWSSHLINPVRSRAVGRARSP
jgi:MFS family permease